MMSKHRKQGFTLVELMVALTIVIIVAATSSAYIGPQMRRNDLINQLKFVKAAVVKAKAQAIEFTAPVQFELQVANNRLLVLRDQDRDGDFTDSPYVIMGKNDTTGILSPYRSNVLVDPDKGSKGLKLWYQEGSFENQVVDVFPTSKFIILPTGRVVDPDTLNPTGGTFFFKTNDDRNFGAVHITAMGEVRMATLREADTSGDFNGWKWTY